MSLSREDGVVAEDIDWDISDIEDDDEGFDYDEEDEGLGSEDEDFDDDFFNNLPDVFHNDNNDDFDGGISMN